MSGNNYDFVGISSSQLPYVHGSFPAAAGGPKYYTMRSVYRGRDADRKRDLSFRQNQTVGLKTDNKVIADLKLSTLELELNNLQKRKSKKDTLKPIVNPSGNINKQKAYLKLKGIYVNQLYSVNRARKSQDETGNTKPIKTEDGPKWSKSRKLSISSRKSNATLPIVNFKLPSINTSSERFSETQGSYSVRSEGSNSEYRSRLREMDREASPIPGISKPKRSHRGRKLGNVVSSQRLQQLLDGDDSLDPGAFFFF
ncbi:uncharacterized protein LOC110455692 [Mizuhopecten yessoensis]|uniref:Uncharacterized protein n=1 Tax=Mizuhopecten yessoensis TaxID=6573 RepID=A0A210QCL5_MIZYE|nr:uncharacterized protein LOC110455692 [Mizuhopecten yessoensis]OWF46497.1 hypothetical protein KP79_PYT05243 [Mizuhopecten yessoensis]